MLKNGRIRGQTRDRELIDVALQCALVQQVTRNVVEPQTLPKIMEFLGRLHRSSSVRLDICRAPRIFRTLAVARNNSPPKGSGSSSSGHENRAERFVHNDTSLDVVPSEKCHLRSTKARLTFSRILSLKGSQQRVCFPSMY